MKTLFTLSLLFLMLCLRPLGAQEGFAPMDHRSHSMLIRIYDELDNSSHHTVPCRFSMLALITPEPATLLQVFTTKDGQYVLNIAVYDKSVLHGSSFAKDRKIIRTSKPLPREIGELLISATIMELLQVSYSGLKQPLIEDGESWLLGVQPEDSDYLCGTRRDELTGRVAWVRECKILLEKYAANPSGDTSAELVTLKAILTKACDQWVMKDK